MEAVAEKHGSIKPKQSTLEERGREAAKSFLYRCGYTILETGWTCFAGTADIIAMEDDTLVFVSVNVQEESEKGFPSSQVGDERRSKFEKIALAYLSEYDQTDFPVRFDIVSIVVLGHDRAMVRHQINAFSVA